MIFVGTRDLKAGHSCWDQKKGLSKCILLLIKFYAEIVGLASKGYSGSDLGLLASASQVPKGVVPK